MKHLEHPTLKNAIPLALAVLSGSTFAQTSSITIFGTADASVRWADTDRVGSEASLASGGYSSSRFGVRGSEDLGGGLSASFWLESFLGLDTGAQSPAGWQRRSTLSLTDQTWGELRLGRDYTPTHANWARFDPFGYVGIGANQLLILSAAGQTPVTAAFGTAPNDIQRANNGVQYILPRNDWNVEGNLLRTLGEGGTAATDQHRAVGGRLGVTVGGLLVSAAMLQTRNNLTGSSSFKDSALAAMYTAPAVKFSAAVRRLEYQAAKQTNYLVGAVVPLGAQDLKVSWNRAQYHGAVGATDISNNRADQFAVGYVYHLSKRTHLYSTAATLRNQGNSRFVIPGAPAATAGGIGSKGFETGINHDF